MNNVVERRGANALWLWVASLALSLGSASGLVSAQSDYCRDIPPPGPSAASDAFGNCACECLPLMPADPALVDNYPPRVWSRKILVPTPSGVVTRVSTRFSAGHMKLRAEVFGTPDVCCDPKVNPEHPEVEHSEVGWIQQVLELDYCIGFFLNGVIPLYLKNQTTFTSSGDCPVVADAPPSDPDFPFYPAVTSAAQDLFFNPDVSVNLQPIPCGNSQTNHEILDSPGSGLFIEPQFIWDSDVLLLVNQILAARCTALAQAWDGYTVLGNQFGAWNASIRSVTTPASLVAITSSAVLTDVTGLFLVTGQASGFAHGPWIPNTCDDPLNLNGVLDIRSQVTEANLFGVCN